MPALLQPYLCEWVCGQELWLLHALCLLDLVELLQHADVGIRVVTRLGQQVDTDGVRLILCGPDTPQQGGSMSMTVEVLGVCNRR